MNHERTPSFGDPSGLDFGPPSASPPDRPLPLTPEDIIAKARGNLPALSLHLLEDFTDIPSFDYLSRLVYPASEVQDEPGAPNYLDNFYHSLESEDHELSLSGTINPGKRPASDSDLQPSPKHARTFSAGPESPCEDNGEDNSDVVSGEPHRDLGLIDGKYACSCGNRYTRQFTLSRHVIAHDPNSRHPCLMCNQTFSREDSLRRHENMKHNGRKVACPGCQKSVRPDYLPRHLATSQNAKCRVVAEAIYMQSSGAMEIDNRPPLASYWTEAVIKDAGRADCSGPQAKPSSSPPKFALSPTLEVPAKTSLASPASSQPIVRQSREPCDLCGMPLGPGETELIDHIGQHSVDFSANPFKCDDCDISFAFSSDLHMHLKAAKTGTCGLQFRHEDRCTGHHGPVPPGSKLVDRRKMQETLWLWENRQLRAHRSTVARLLAERVQYTQGSRYSLPDNEVSCLAILSRLSMTSVDSFHSLPVWIRLQEEVDIDELDTDLRGLDLISEDRPAPPPKDVSAAADRPFARPESTILKPLRPESTALRRPDELDFIMKREDGQFKLVLLRSGDLSPPPNTYVEQVKSMRSPGSLKTRASGVKFRARAAARYLSPKAVEAG